VTEISIRDLRNHGGEVIERVERGERLTVTRDGRPVAQLLPLDRRPQATTALLRRWSKLPAMDPDSLRRDLDDIIDSRP
jgi:prevent-host-death family protein